MTRHKNDQIITGILYVHGKNKKFGGSKRGHLKNFIANFLSNPVCRNGVGKSSVRENIQRNSTRQRLENF